MKVEETFGIKIPDQEAEQILTVGDFHNAVWGHLSGNHSDKCKSQSLFYKLRKSLADSFSFPPKQLSLDTSPELIFPKQNRRKLYIGFGDQINLKLPDLILTKSWAVILSIFGFATIIGSLIISIVLINIYDCTKWTLLFCLVGIVLTFLLSEFLNPKRTVIKEITFRDFTQHTLALNYSTLRVTEGTNRIEMEGLVNYIISDLAGLDIEEVTPEKKISDDLGID